jgi:hypothetical protein
VVTQALIQLVSGIVVTLLALLPSLPSGVVDWLDDFGEGAETVGSYAALVNQWFPVDVLVLGLVLLLALRAVIGVWRLLVFLYGLIPGKAT